jgi:hypothetical protein
LIADARAGVFNLILFVNSELYFSDLDIQSPAFYGGGTPLHVAVQMNDLKVNYKTSISKGNNVKHINNALFESEQNLQTWFYLW